MKKAQVMGMPLVMIFALIIGAIVLVWGLFQIYELIAFADEVELKKNIDNIRAKIEIFENFDETATDTYQLIFPQKIEVICFYDQQQAINCKIDNQDCTSQFQQELELVLGSDNVYLYPFETTTSYFTVKNLKPKEGNPYCISNYNQALLEKEVDHVSITHYEQ